MAEKTENNLDAIATALIITFSVATICVIIYLIFGLYIFASLALAIYTISFSLIALASLRKLFIVARYSERINALAANENLTEAERDDVKKERAEAQKAISKVKTVAIIKSCLSGAFAIFTLVVLVLL